MQWVYLPQANIVSLVVGDEGLGHRYFSAEKFRDPDSLAFASSVFRVLHRLTNNSR